MGERWELEGSACIMYICEIVKKGNTIKKRIKVYLKTKSACKPHCRLVLICENRAI